MEPSPKLKDHQVLVEITAADLERPRLGAVTHKTQAFVERDGSSVRRGRGEVDLLHARAGVIEQVLQEAPADPSTARLRRHIDAPDVAPVASFLAFELAEAGD